MSCSHEWVVTRDAARAGCDVEASLLASDINLHFRKGIKSLMSSLMTCGLFRIAHSTQQRPLVTVRSYKANEEQFFGITSKSMRGLG